MGKTEKTIRETIRENHKGKVSIKLPIEKGKDKVLLVSINGVRYGIERGKTVEVPWNVAEVIEQSEKSDAAIAERVAYLEHNPIMTVR